MTRLLGIASLSLLLAAGVIRGDEKSAPFIGEMHIQTLPPLNYQYAPIETDFKSMVEPLGKTLTALFQAADQKKIKIRGPVIHIYFGSPHLAPEKPFKM